MFKAFAKDFVLWSISKGCKLPHSLLNRTIELIFLRDLLAQLKIDCVLDVGANRGQFAYELRKTGYTGLIISFEPISTVFRALQERFANDSSWIGHQIALGSSDERKTITVPGNTLLSSFLEPIFAFENRMTETVEIRRLDGLLPTILPDADSMRIFLKMDTQGYDLEVFRGASGCLDKIQGIQSELSVQPLYKDMPHYLEVLEEYETAGFHLFNLSVVNRIDTGGLLELNCLMRRSFESTCISRLVFRTNI
jgi:FkbM family methyltransferase